jgi:AraC-like DNA-binding protein
MEYFKTSLKEEFIIKRIITVHYFEYAKDYVFKGEMHNFWELLYVDKGEVEVTTDKATYLLKQGEMIFHKPNEFHNVRANGKIAPNLIVIAFDCLSKSMKFFIDKIIKINNKEKNFLGEIVTEARNAFSSALDDPLLNKLEKRTNAKFGSEQFIKLYLEQMLLTMIRKEKYASDPEKATTTVKQRADDDLVNKIKAFLEENSHGSISFEEVCKKFTQSKTNLKILFKSNVGMGVMDYYRELKIEQAKKLIREESYNFSGISELLGYHSVHYFSRYFKKATGMTPTEYATSVKAKSDF